VSLLVTSLFIAGGVLVGRWMARAGTRARRGDVNLPPAGEGGRASLPSASRASGASGASGASPAPASVSAPRVVDWSRFSLALGDVLVRAGGEEAWLAGAVVLSEERPAMALFIAPEAGGDRALLVHALPADDVVWLEPLPADEIALGAEPPTSLEVRGTRYDRARRLPLRAARVGTGAPDLGDVVIVAEYAASGPERLLVITGGGSARVWRGELLERGMYDVLPSGSATLDHD
jgi:hypothetical protein